ncbi:unnamed protein product [Gongylonema pulchrum]|uniref:MMS19 nucleotide excision repair protein n=1 Tax=Gongylonema pulchrum TaxID=637853 RepID=A0A183E202_9BILA|nr:unnamed protein product [Gongylonema pulchrum]
MRKGSQPLISAVFDLFNATTKKTSLFLDNRSCVADIHSLLPELLNIYQREEFERYKSVEVDIEEKSMDLILVFDILANILSKEFISFSEADLAHVGICIAFNAFEILLPILNSELLQLPNLCKKFYLFILYFIELEPRSLDIVPEKTYNAIIEFLRAGVSSDYGPEPTFRLCLTESTKADMLAAAASALFALGLE